MFISPLPEVLSNNGSEHDDISLQRDCKESFPDPLQGLLEILSNASEYDDIPVRPGEEVAVQRLLAHAPLALDKPKYTDPHTKVNALVQVRRHAVLR